MRNKIGVFTFTLSALFAFNVLNFSFLHAYECDFAMQRLENKNLGWFEAVQKTIHYSPRLKMIEADIQSASARVNEVALLPNPLLNIGWGQNDWGAGNNVNGGEFNVTINQLLEMGGKRAKRVDLATYQYYATYSDYEIAKLAVLKELAFAFIDAAANQEKLRLAIEQKKLTKAFLLSIEAQLETGKVPIIEYHKATVDHANAEIVEERASQSYTNAKERLSLLWGAPCECFDWIEYPFYRVIQPSSVCWHLDQLPQHPLILKEQIYYAAALAGLRLERSNSIPDVILQVGVSRDCGDRETGLTLGVTFPLPIFNRNQWGIAKANSQVCKIENEWEQVNLGLQNLVRKAHSEFLISYKLLEKMESSILPATQKTLAFVEATYKEGKVDYFEVLKAYEYNFNIQLRYIDALADYHKMRVSLDYLDGV